MQKDAAVGGNRRGLGTHACAQAHRHTPHPTTPRQVTTNYLDDPRDLETLREGLKLGRKIGQVGGGRWIGVCLWLQHTLHTYPSPHTHPNPPPHTQTTAFDGYRASEVYPGEHVQSDADLDAYIRGGCMCGCGVAWQQLSFCSLSLSHTHT